MVATIQGPIKPSRPAGQQIERLARAIVDAHSHFYRRADRFKFECCDDMLVIRGSVPSFYLKQVLQTALQELSSGFRIDNQVAVVSLSSIEPNDE
jgi:hypothetical protein